MLFKYFVIYKPFQVLSQFTAADDKKSLKDFFDVPRDVYPVGRLDYDSEGLLLLTDDKKLNHHLLHPAMAHEREYWVQVEGIPGDTAVKSLQEGLVITIDGKAYKTKKCSAAIIKTDPLVPPRNPPIRFRKDIPDSWIRLILTEGKNRQVRKMTAKAGYPTLRLIRYRIAQITIQGLQPGDMRELNTLEIKSLFT